MTNLKLTQKVKAHIGSFTSPKLTKYIVSLLVFFSTTQLSLHFWLKDSYLYSIPIDYLAPALYFFDILAFLSIIYFYLLKPTFLTSFLKSLSPLMLLLILNTLTSSFSLISLTWSLRIVVYAILALYISKITSALVVSRAIIFTAIFHLLLSALQIYSSSSIGGPFYWLGERFINMISPNVAKATVLGESMLRPYSTFSHPNVLAGWLITSLIYLTMTANTHKNRFFLKLIPHYLLLFLTLSRSALLALLLLPKKLAKSHLALRLAIFAGAAVLLLFSTNTLIRNSSSLTDRLQLTKGSLLIISQKPAFGAGLNASLTLYDDYLPNTLPLQPDHNSITLLFSYFGVSLLSLAIYSSSLKPYFKASLAPLVPLLLLDHYFFTAPQTLFMLILLLSIIYAKNN